MANTLVPALFVVAAAISQAQWVKEPAAGVPRTRDGKPNLSAPVPKLNGKPDLSGIWQPDQAAPGEIDKIAPGIALNAVPGDDPSTFPKYFFNVLADYKEGEITLTTEGERAQKALAAITKA